jgi:hypothetical protein
MFPSVAPFFDRHWLVEKRIQFLYTAFDHCQGLDRVENIPTFTICLKAELHEREIPVPQS